MNAGNETMLYRGGVVRTMSAHSGGEPRHDTLVTRGGRIAGVANDSDIRALAGKGARVVELRGATVTPGFVDHPPHLFHFSLLTYPLVKLCDALSHDDIVARVAHRAGRPDRVR